VAITCRVNGLPPKLSLGLRTLISLNKTQSSIVESLYRRWLDVLRQECRGGLPSCDGVFDILGTSSLTFRAPGQILWKQQGEKVLDLKIFILTMSWGWLYRP
jgi:hypothetical protein